MGINLRISGLPVIAFKTVHRHKEMEYTKYPERWNAFLLERAAKMYPTYLFLPIKKIKKSSLRELTSPRKETGSFLLRASVVPTTLLDSWPRRSK